MTIKIKKHIDAKIETKVLKLSEIKANPKDPKKHDQELLDQSFREFGQVAPMIVDEKNMLLAGHGRRDSMERLGYKEAEVIVKRGLTKKQKEKYLLLDNKLTERGGWDYELLANFSEDELLEGGWDLDELDSIFDLDFAEDYDAKAEFRKAVKNPMGVKTGDIWQLGEHKLIIGDSTNRKTWERLFGKERFELMFTDPPFRLSYCKNRFRKVHTKDGWKLKGQRAYENVGETDKKGKPKGFGANQNRIYEGIVERGVPEFDEWLSIANDFQNPIGANVMIFENWKNTVELWQAIEKYWKIRNMVIWHTPNRMQGFSAKHQFFSKYDIAELADKGKAELNEKPEEELENYLLEKGQKLLDTNEIAIYGNKGDSTWDRKKGKWGKVADHITYPVETSSSGQNVVFGTKPVQILVPYIKVLSKRGGIVAEPYAGSGSMIIGCEIMHRKCRAIEISPTYAEIIISRFKKFSGKEAIKIG